LGRPLPNRRNVVVSSHPVHGAEWYSSIRDALGALASEKTVFGIGGGQVYAQLLDDADELYLTVIDREVVGDVFFPPYEHLVGTTFRLADREVHEGFAFERYTRIPRDH